MSVTRVAIIGYGAVASVHARQLRKLPGVEVSAICGPDGTKAQRFAGAHQIARAVTNIEEALGGADAAIVCSPSPRHAEQASQVLEARVPVLVELPPCETLTQANQLSSLAAERGVTLECAHTSRYLAPFADLGRHIAGGLLGDVEQIHYVRSIPPRQRSWVDDALLHHASHPLDLLLTWFSDLRPVACAAHPLVQGAQNLCALAQLGSGAPVSVVISYTARLPEVRMTVIGSAHTFATDGFSFVRSDLDELNWEGDGQHSYEQAILNQDAAFLAACRGGPSGVNWQATIRLTALIERFRKLWEQTR